MKKGKLGEVKVTVHVDQTWVAHGELHIVTRVGGTDVVALDRYPIDDLTGAPE